MDLELDADQQELRDHARAFLADACPPSLVRDVFEGRPQGAGLWEQMVELGWPGLGASVDDGGLGEGFVGEAVLASELGRVVAPTPFLATVTQFAPLLANAPVLRSEVASGRVTGALALTEAVGHRAADVATTARPTDGGGWVLDGVKTHVLDGATAEEVAVVARLDGTSGADGVGAFVVPGQAVGREPLDVIDPTMLLATIRFDGVEVGTGQVLHDPGDPASFRAIERARLHATVAMAVSSVASSRMIFELTVAYAKERHQFGRPIGSFQAVKHRLADLYLAVERADALAWFAVTTVAEQDERLPIAASMAKAAAADCQRLATRDGLQLHGGIGFTWEHDLHFWLKRTLTTSMLLGNAEAHRADLVPLLGLAS
jgi:alkylation response protein AidB-like acyl-CoA dehydrogenase